MRIEKIGEKTQITQQQKTTAYKSSKLDNQKMSKQRETIKAHQREQVKKKDVQEKDLIDAIEAANKSVKTYDRRLEYRIHEKTHEIMVKVIDTSGDEDRIIREIPSEKVLDMVAKMWELAGILVDEKA
jgi:flagellar protein FlaG